MSSYNPLIVLLNVSPPMKGISGKREAADSMMANSTFCIWLPLYCPCWSCHPKPPNCHDLSLSHNTAKLLISIFPPLKDNLTGYLCGHFSKAFVKTHQCFTKKILQTGALKKFILVYCCILVVTLFDCEQNLQLQEMHVNFLCVSGLGN